MAYNVVTESEASRMIELYATGLSSNDIGKQLGRDVALKGKAYTGYRMELRAVATRVLRDWIYSDSSPSIRCERKFGISNCSGDL